MEEPKIEASKNLKTESQKVDDKIPDNFHQISNQTKSVIENVNQKETSKLQEEKKTNIKAQEIEKHQEITGPKPVEISNLDIHL